MSKVMPHILTVLVVTLGALSWWQSTQGFQAFTWESYRRLHIEQYPIAVPNITLENHDKQTFDIASLQGKVLLVNFIYTRCPTVCGIIGMNYSVLRKQIADAEMGDQVKLLSISLEPDYDSPKRLDAYMRRFSKHSDDSWQVTRPYNHQQGEMLLNKLGVVSIPDGYGGITHNAATHIVDQRGRLVKLVDETENEITLQEVKQLMLKNADGVNDAS